MLGFPLRLSRSMRRLVGALCLAGAAPAYAASADDALMALEHAQARYEAMLDSAQYASGLLRVLYEDRAAVPDTIEIADTQVRKSFKVPVAMTAMREAMAQTPDLPDDQAQALVRIAKDWAQRDAALRALPESALAAEGEAMARRMAERQDADAIEALLPLMAEPALAEENVLAAERVYRLMEILVVEGHAQAKAEIELHGDDGLRSELIDIARATPAEYRALGQEREVERQRAMFRQRYVLSYLPPEEVRTLQSIYTSEAGRAKRDALVKAFAARNDADSLSALLGMVDAL